MTHPFTCTVNDQAVTLEIEDDLLLVQLLRDKLELTGTHIGCDTGQCGVCVVHLDGKAVKSCNVLARQVEGRALTTIEGLGRADNLHAVQEAFRECHGLQCGFCTPGMIMSAVDLLKRKPNPSEEDIREGLEGNFCRCTGYHNIVKSIQWAAEKMASEKSPS